ncbi:MAG: hypothetical protein Fur0021_21450 [Candidatus Promineifilaceae bacterium]
MTSLTGGPSRIQLEIFTDAHRVSCQMAVGMRGLHAELADSSSNYLEVEDVYISRVNQPAEITANYARCALRKDNIKFVVLQDRREGLPMGSHHAQSVYTRGRPVPVFLTVPGFEIRGELRHDGKVSAALLMAQAISRYLFVFAATAAAALQPQVVYHGDLIMVDAAQVGVLGIEEHR